MKILILALSGIGDALMFTPALKLIRQSQPTAQIDALVMFNGTREVYQTNLYINSVIHFDFLKEGVIASLKFVLGLRKKYDATINVYPSNRKEYNVINFLLGAKQRAGIEYLRANNQNLGWLNNVTVLENDQTHNVQTNIKLIEKLLNKKFDDEPAMEINLSDDHNRFADDFLEKNNIKENDFVVGFHPGCAILKNHIVASSGLHSRQIRVSGDSYRVPPHSKATIRGSSGQTTHTLVVGSKRSNPTVSWRK